MPVPPPQEGALLPGGATPRGWQRTLTSMTKLACCMGPLATVGDQRHELCTTDGAINAPSWGRPSGPLVTCTAALCIPATEFLILHDGPCRCADLCAGKQAGMKVVSREFHRCGALKNIHCVGGHFYSF